MTAFDADAWLGDNWCAELTVDEWWARLAGARLSHPMLPEPWGRGWGPAETSVWVEAMVRCGALGPPTGLGLVLAAPAAFATKLTPRRMEARR